MKLIKTEKIHHGRLSKGCKQCIKGRKSVLFITSKCHYTCFYCPISDDKRENETIKINEKNITNPNSLQAINEVIKEIKLCQSKGVGITGGDPLATISRTTKYIKEIKKEFGKKFHIHLYTSPQFVTKEKIEQLEKVGLDEIRFHLNVESDKLWNKIELAKESKMKIGIEIPAIPGMYKETTKMLDYAKKSKIIKFVNLNELEYSDASIQNLKAHEFFTKNEISYAIKDSEKEAIKLVEYGQKISLRTHYCSAQFKDAVQLGNRFRLRAKSVAKTYEQIDPEGMIIRGEISLKEKSKIKEMEENIIKFKIPKKYFKITENKIFLHPAILEDIWEENKDYKKKFKAEIIKEYPTDDHFNLERYEL